MYVALGNKNNFMTLEDCRGRCSMDYSIPIDEVNSILKLCQQQLENMPFSRSSNWSSALKGKMMEGAMENSKDGKRKQRIKLSFGTSYICEILARLVFLLIKHD